MVDDFRDLEAKPSKADLRRLDKLAKNIKERKAFKNALADSRGEVLPFPDEYGEPTSNRHIFRVLTKGGRVFYRCRPYYKGVRRNAGTFATFKAAEAVAADILAGNGYQQDTPQISKLESTIGRLQYEINQQRAKLAEMKAARRWYVKEPSPEQSKGQKAKPGRAPSLLPAEVLQAVQLRPYKPKRGEKAFKTDFEHITRIESQAGERYHIHLVFLDVDGGEEFEETFDAAAYRLQSWRRAQHNARRAKLEAARLAAAPGNDGRHSDIC
jgi:hypothetical protein